MTETRWAPTPPSHTPLSSIDWVQYTAPSVINVFFAANGATVNDDGNGAFTATGWGAAELAAAKAAFTNYEAVANVHFNYVSSIAQADFVMVENPDTPGTAIEGNFGYWDVGGSHIVYNGSSYAVDGIGVFNSADASWTAANLAVGAYGYITLIHEIGHGMGLAHPHDHGGGSDIMDGVSSAFDDYGSFNLNQGVFTTMSYNDGWHTAPQVPERIATVGNYGFGWQGTLMALDIAELQIKYGANTTHNSGNNTYTLSDTNASGTYYQAVWDTGGTDTFLYTGSRNAVIGLQAATLGYSSSGGGVVSYVAGIYGGLTIANGVVIENATGGSGNDKITGNSAANRLSGGSGSDTLTGYSGNDSLNGGAGKDTLTGGAGKDMLTGGSGSDRFVFNATLSASTNVDTIKDFVHGSDKIALDNAVMAGLGLATGALSSAKFYAHAGATHGHDSSDRIVYDTTSGKLYYDSNGSAAGGVTQIAILTGHPTLSAGDFLIV